MNMGTRFIATVEATIHPTAAMVEADERATDIIFRTYRNSARVARNAVSQKRCACAKAGHSRRSPISSRACAVARVWNSGETDHGIRSAGQVQGLIEDVPTVKVLVDRIIDEAEALIRQRLAGMLTAA